MVINMLYHGSCVDGLKTLKPFVSEHGKAYVYLSKNKVLSALYTVHKFDRPYNWYPYSFSDTGVPMYFECYENALFDVYGGKKGYIYECEKPENAHNPTNINGAYTCLEPVSIINCTEIEDMYEWFLQAEQNGEFAFRRFCDMSENALDNFSRMAESEIKKFDLHNKSCDYADFLRTRFPKAWKNTL